MENKIRPFKIIKPYLKSENILDNKFNEINEPNKFFDIKIRFSKEKIKIDKSIILNSVKIKKNNIIIILLLLINSFIEFLTLDNLSYSIVKLKIKGTGEKKIYGSNFRSIDKIREIYINDNKKSNNDNIFISNQEVNAIEIKLDNVVYDLENFFNECKDITEVDFVDFDTSNTIDMNWMFKGCSSLTSINIINFDTSQVTDMHCMFCDCALLTSLNIPNFDTSKVENMNDMFNGCNKLEYINFKNFKETELSSYDNIFKDIPDNVVVCVNENNIKNKILPELKQKVCYTNYCSENWKSQQKKLINPDINGCKCELDNCLACSNSDSNKKLCTNCNNFFHKKEDDNYKDGNYFYCYKEPNGYYLDSINSLYKKCYDTCNTCLKNGNDKVHNCLTCNPNFQFEIKSNNSINCYEKCDYYYYFDKDKKIIIVQ